MNIDSELTSKINKAIAEEFELDIEDLKPEAHLVTDLELDSLDFVDLTVVLQNTCGVTLREEEELRKIRTVQDLHDFVRRTLEKEGKL
jgi:acyl carrier protein